MPQKHSFDPKAYRRQCVPFLFLSMLPSLLLDGYLAYHLAAHQPSFFIQTDIRSFWDAAAPFAANFMLLKAPVIFAYFKFRIQRLESYVCLEDKQVVYRTNKMALFAKLDHGYVYHDDYYFRDLESVKCRKNGAIAIFGDIQVLRKLSGIEAVWRQWKKKIVIIPSYYTDMNSIALKLESLANE